MARTEWSEDDEADMTFHIKSQGFNGECIDADITAFLKKFAKIKKIGLKLGLIIPDASNGAIMGLRF